MCRVILVGIIEKENNFQVEKNWRRKFASSIHDVCGEYILKLNEKKLPQERNHDAIIDIETLCSLN